LSTDKGKTWTYPKSLFKNLQSVIDVNFLQETFNDVSCSGNSQYNFCDASGHYSTLTNTYPLTAISTDRVKTWTYPSYIYKNPQLTIDPSFANGRFFKVSLAEEHNIICFLYSS
jgi:hypothetical protein